MKKICLDAGHGLNVAGKQTPDGIKEWTLNDKVRDKVVALLKDYDVEFLFADNDEGHVNESLSDRYKKYINAGVDVFVSIHHNAYNGKWNNVTGVEVFVDKKYTAKDMELAEAIYKNLPGYTGLKGRGIKKENWYVINQNKIPAVLVEGGFMDSKIDYPIITSDKGQDGYAKAVAEGLIAFLGLKKIVVEKKEESYTVKVTTASLNVRSGPSTKHKVVTTVKKNQVYTIVETSGNWGKLKSGAGWICLDYTSKNTAATVKAEPSYKTMTVTASVLNIRKGPGILYKVVGTYKKGTKVKVYSISKGWAKGDKGYMSATYLK